MTDNKALVERLQTTADDLVRIGWREDRANVLAAIEALSHPLPTMEEVDKRRDAIKSIINGHVQECFRLSGHKGLPCILHPGPTADAILSLMESRG